MSLDGRPTPKFGGTMGIFSASFMTLARDVTWLKTIFAVSSTRCEWGKAVGVQYPYGRKDDDNAYRLLVGLPRIHEDRHILVPPNPVILPLPLIFVEMWRNVNSGLNRGHDC
jgi:hypothetical protein